MPLYADAGRGAALNYLAGKTDDGDDAAVRGWLKRLPQPGGWPVPQAGMWFNGYGSAGGTIAVTLDRLVLRPFGLPAFTRVDRISVEAATGAANAVMRLGLYRFSDNFSTLNLVVDAGTVSVSSSGAKAVSFSPLALRPGFYMTAACNQTASAGTLRCHANTEIPSWTSFLPRPSQSVAYTTSVICGYYVDGVTGAFASSLSWASVSTTSSSVPGVLLRTA